MHARAESDPTDQKITEEFNAAFNTAEKGFFQQAIEKLYTFKIQLENIPEDKKTLISKLYTKRCQIKILSYQLKLKAVLIHDAEKDFDSFQKKNANTQWPPEVKVHRMSLEVDLQYLKLELEKYPPSSRSLAVYLVDYAKFIFKQFREPSTLSMQDKLSFLRCAQQAIEEADQIYKTLINNKQIREARKITDEVFLILVSTYALSGDICFNLADKEKEAAKKVDYLNKAIINYQKTLVILNDANYQTDSSYAAHALPIHFNILNAWQRLFEITAEENYAEMIATYMKKKDLEIWVDDLNNPTASELKTFKPRPPSTHLAIFKLHDFENKNGESKEEFTCNEAREWLNHYQNFCSQISSNKKEEIDDDIPILQLLERQKKAAQEQEDLNNKCQKKLKK